MPFYRYFLFFHIVFLFFCNIQAKEYHIDELPNLKLDAVHQVASHRIFNYFKQYHFRNIDLTDDFSARIVARYFKQLDNNKSFFLKQDIDSFSDKKIQLCKGLMSGDISTAFDIYNLSLRKKFQRYEYALSLLSTPMDFSLNESIDFDREKISWPKTESELDEYWRKKVKYDELNLILSGKTEQEVKTLLTKRYSKILRTLIQTNAEDAFQLFMNAFAKEIDPHTSYLAPRSKQDFDSEMNLLFEGIGATLTQDDDDTQIVSLVAGGPAAKSKNLSIGDSIIGVGEENQPIEDVIGWRLDDIVEKIRGPKGTVVRLEIQPKEKNSKNKIIKIVRDEIHFEDHEAKLEIKNTSYGKIGVLNIPSFYNGLTQKVFSLLSDANNKNLNGIIIDLRNDGGGSLAEVISLTGLFIGNGPVVQVKDNIQRIVVYDSQSKQMMYKKPIVVMVNRYSASASEIFSAALQDYGRAVIIGENTFGKGTVQISRNIAYPLDKKIHPDWPELGGVQYTIQKFYRINGDSTQLNGVIPDIQLNNISYNNKIGERYLDNSLPWDRINKADYTKISDVLSFLPILQKNHQIRLKNNTELNYLNEDIQEYNNKKDQFLTVSLNKKIREIEQKTNESKQLLRMNERLSKRNLPQIKKLSELPKDFKIDDANLDEASNILIDLIKLTEN